MDRLRSLFGSGRQNETSPLAFSADVETVVRHPPAASQTITIETENNNKSANIVEKDTETMEDKFDKLGSSIRKYMAEIIPLEEGDCLSCKLIGATVCWGSAVYLLYGGRRLKPGYTGRQRIILYIQVSSLATGLFLLGTARLFDLSIFQKRAEGEPIPSIADLVYDDLKKAKSRISSLTSDENDKK